MPRHHHWRLAKEVNKGESQNSQDKALQRGGSAAATHDATQYRRIDSDVGYEVYHGN